MHIKILVADDDACFRELICDILGREGFITIEAENGRQALECFYETTDLDLVILDVMMPVYDGWEVLKEIRKHSEVSVMMLTALGDERHEIAGLENGANDYLSKPFSYELFLARIHAILRKIQKERTSDLRVGKLHINQTAHKVMIGETVINLDRKEFGLLVYLINNKGRVLTRDQILNAVWGFDFEGDIRTIDTHIKTLRSKLLDCGGYIKTIRGIGYMMEVDR